MEAHTRVKSSRPDGLPAGEHEQARSRCNHRRVGGHGGEPVGALLRSSERSPASRRWRGTPDVECGADGSSPPPAPGPSDDTDGVCRSDRGGRPRLPARTGPATWSPSVDTRLLPGRPRSGSSPHRGRGRDQTPGVNAQPSAAMLTHGGSSFRLRSGHHKPKGRALYLSTMCVGVRTSYPTSCSQSRRSACRSPKEFE